MDLAVVHTPDGLLMVCPDKGGSVWTWEPHRDEWRKRPLTCAFTGDPDAAAYSLIDNEIDRVAAAVVGGRVLLAAGGDEQAAALWDMETGELLRNAFHTESYLAQVAVLEGDDPPRFVVAPQYHDDLRIWGNAKDPAAESRLGNSAEEYRCLATARIGGRSLVAAGWSEVSVWDVDRDERVAGFSPGDEARAAALTVRGGRPVVVAAADPVGELYVWEVGADDDEQDDGPGEPLFDPMTGHGTRVFALGTALVGGRPIAMSGDQGGALAVWDIEAGRRIGDPFAAHDGEVTAVRTTELDGRPVALTSGRDGRVRCWDLSGL